MRFFNKILISALSKAITNNPPLGDYSELVFEDTDYYDFKTYGQSNSVGEDTAPGISLNNIVGNYMLGIQHYNLSQPNPLELNPLTVPDGLLPNGESCAEGIAPPWVNAFRTGLSREIPNSPVLSKDFIATTCGTGGRTVAQLSKGGGEYNLFLNTLTWAKTIADGENKSISCPAIYYAQGESDLGTTGATWKASTIQLLNDLRADVMASYGQANPPIILLYQPKDANNGVKRSCMELIQEYDWIIGTGNIYKYPERNLHLDPNGARWCGEHIAKAMVETMRTGNKYEPLYPVNFAKVGNSIQITYNKDVVLHKPETQNGLSMDGISNSTIQSVTASGNVVTMNLNFNAETYGDINLRYINGTIRDAETYQATTQYVDYRATSSYSPIGSNTNDFTDESGDIIYGQLYPMWNWSLEFYTTI